jgi:hypothetical protein
MGKYAKAVTGALIAGLTALLPALDDGAVTAAEWVVVAVATLGALGLVWAVPNAKDITPKP